MIEDMESLDARTKEFNSKFKPNGNLKWIEVKNGKNYNIKIDGSYFSFCWNISDSGLIWE